MEGQIKRFVYAVVVVHLIWALGALALDRPLLPTPWAVYAYFPTITWTVLWQNLIASLFRLSVSLSCASLLGIISGIALVRFKRLGQLCDPLLYFLYPLPKIAFLPVLMLLFGLGDGSKIIMITLITVFQITIGVRDAVRQIPAELYQTLDVLAASRVDLFKTVTWPASLAGFLSALKIALGTALATLFFTEIYGTQVGLGYFIMDEWNRLDYRGMFVGIVVLSGLAYLLFSLIELAEGYFLRWQRA